MSRARARRLPLRSRRAVSGIAAAVLVLPAVACVATRQDVQILRNDLAAVRADAARGDSLRQRETERMLAALGVVRDSVRALAGREVRFQGDVREALRSINEQLLQVQELTGQSQRRLQDLRATLEGRAESVPSAGTPPLAPPPATTPPISERTAPTSGSAPAPGASGAGTAGTTRPGATSGATSGAASGTGAGTGAGSGAAPAASPRTTPPPAGGGTTVGRPSTGAAPRTPAPTADTAARADEAAAEADDAGGPGPNELYKLALDQYRRGSWATARAGFSDLLRRYPTADVAPEAQYYVAEAYASERNLSQADAAYASVVTRYPQSSRAATALYKRARLKVAANRRAEARPLFEEVVRRYPRSDEAVLSREALRTLGDAGGDR